jgi:uncharacterized ferredoxin-like protein
MKFNLLLFLVLIPFVAHAGGYWTGIPDHTNLSGGTGTNTHAQLDTHVASTANPHSVDQSDIQTGFVEEISGHIETADDKDYKLVQKAQYARQVTSIALICTTGAASVALEVDSTNITTCENIAANAGVETEVTCDTGATNDLAAGETLDLEISNNASCEDFAFTVKTTRD